MRRLSVHVVRQVRSHQPSRLSLHLPRVLWAVISWTLIVFVGKPHRGLPDTVLPSGVIRPNEMVEGCLWNKGWPYWRYARQVAKDLHGPSASDFIAITNLIKCTNVGAGMAHLRLTPRARRWPGAVFPSLASSRRRSSNSGFHVGLLYLGLFPEVIQQIPVALGDSSALSENCLPTIHGNKGLQI